MLDSSAERTGQTPMVLATDGDAQESRDALGCLKSIDKSVANCEEVTNMNVDAPSAPGVWRRSIDNSWELYPSVVAENIFLGFCDGKSYMEWVESTASPRKRKRDGEDEWTDLRSTGPTHRLYFETMKEVELLTGNEVDVSIVRASISSLNYRPTDDPIEAGVWWKDDFGNWHCYGEPFADDVRSALRRRDKFVILKKIFTGKHPEGVEFIINLTKMYQRSPHSGKKRPLKIVQNERMPAENWFQNDAAACNFTVYSLGKDLVRSSLKTLLSLQVINSVVSKTVVLPHKILAIEPSKYLKDDGLHPRYQKFRHAVETIIKCIPGCCGQLMRIFRPETILNIGTSTRDHKHPASGETKPILQHVFYLAPPSEIANILENGLQSNQDMKSENFALTTDYYVPSNKSWESSTYSLLMFLILVPRSCSNAERMEQAIPVASVEHQLPIAKVTLRIIPETESGVHESLQSRVTGISNRSDQQSAYEDNCPVQALSSSHTPAPTAEPELEEITTTEDVSTKIFLLPSKLGEEIVLVFKLYCPESEVLRFVGARVVPIKSQLTELLEWLQEIAGLPSDAEILLYREEDSTKCIDLNSTCKETRLEDASVLAYSNILTTSERRGYRCPDFPTFREHVHSRQVMHFRKLSNPAVDEFSLELSKKHTYSDVAEQVAQYLGLDDDSRMILTFNDCFLQRPRPLPLGGYAYSTLIGDVHKQTTSILYYEVSDCDRPELDGMMTLTFAFHNWKGEKLSAHEIELPKRSTVQDAIERLKKLVNATPAVEMRICEVHSNRVSRIHPANEKIGYICRTDDLPIRPGSLRAMEISEEDRNMGPHDLLIHVRHFDRRDNSSRKCDFFGEPFLMVVRGHEILAQVKERIRGRAQMLETEFLECKFVLIYEGRREYLHADDLVAKRMQEVSLGFYDPLRYFLGLEHGNTSPILTLATRDVPVIRAKPSKPHHAAESVNRALTLRITPTSTSQGESDPKSYSPQYRESGSDLRSDESNYREIGLAVDLMQSHVVVPEDRLVDTLRNQDPNSGLAEGSRQTFIKYTTDTRAKQVREEHNKTSQVGEERVRALGQKLVLTVVELPANQESSESISEPASTPLPICGYTSPDRATYSKTPQILVPDPEFHDFDSYRDEKDVAAGQVWAIYDDHDGMPRFYGLITRVTHSPFEVEIAWLEPKIERRWWVDKTGLSLTLGEFEISSVTDIENNIGVFSHLVLEKSNPMRGVITVYPRKGEVWAIFSDWDLGSMIGPKPIPTPNGILKRCYEFDIVQILEDYCNQRGLLVLELVKTEGFQTVFQPLHESVTQIYQPKDLKKFSHRIPAARMDNISAKLLRDKGYVELDPASLPSDLTLIGDHADTSSFLSSRSE